MSLATIPDDYAKSLAQLNRRAQEHLPYVLALHNIGWPHRAIAEAFGVSKVTVGNWLVNARLSLTHALQASSLFPPPPPLTASHQGTSVKRLKPSLTKDKADHLVQLAATAHDNTRWSRKDSPERLASLELDELLHHYVKDKNIETTYLADVLGVTRRAITQRVIRQEKRNA